MAKRFRPPIADLIDAAAELPPHWVDRRFRQDHFPICRKGCPVCIETEKDEQKWLEERL